MWEVPKEKESKKYFKRENCSHKSEHMMIREIVNILDASVANTWNSWAWYFIVRRVPVKFPVEEVCMMDIGYGIGPFECKS